MCTSVILAAGAPGHSHDRYIWRAPAVKIFSRGFLVVSITTQSSTTVSLLTCQMTMAAVDPGATGRQGTRNRRKGFSFLFAGGSKASSSMKEETEKAPDKAKMTRFGNGNPLKRIREWRRGVDDSADRSVTPSSTAGSESLSLHETIRTEAEATTGNQEAFLALPEFKPQNTVALLLIHPESRRFQVMQLQFDDDGSDSSTLVSDILAHIQAAPSSVNQNEGVDSNNDNSKTYYTGLCRRDGVEMSADQRLATLVDSSTNNDVLLAIPVGVSAKECSRMAQPILGDKKVAAMVSVDPCR
jgi:hypothetical protein